MGIFDTNSRHPIEGLYDEVRDILNETLPLVFQKRLEYGMTPLYSLICNELDKAFQAQGLWGKPRASGDGKIHSLRVQQVGYVKLSPVFIVKIKFDYEVNEEFLVGKEGVMDRYAAYTEHKTY